MSPQRLKTVGLRVGPDPKCDSLQDIVLRGGGSAVPSPYVKAPKPAESNRAAYVVTPIDKHKV